MYEFVGAVEALQAVCQAPCLRDAFSSFSGTSAGAAVAVALACGLTHADVRRAADVVVHHLSSVDLLAYSGGTGLLDVHALVDVYLEPVLRAAGLSATCTFEQFARATQRPVTMYATCLDDGALKELSATASPALPVHVGLQMSCCVPLLCKPVSHNGRLYCDGAVLASFTVPPSVPPGSVLGLRCAASPAHLGPVSCKNAWDVVRRCLLCSRAYHHASCAAAASCRLIDLPDTSTSTAGWLAFHLSAAQRASISRTALLRVLSALHCPAPCASTCVAGILAERLAFHVAPILACRRRGKRIPAAPPAAQMPGPSSAPPPQCTSAAPPDIAAAPDAARAGSAGSQDRRAARSASSHL